jgi:hypothetical protein
MPFASKAQARFMFSQRPDLAKGFADATPSIKQLPQHFADKKQQPKRRRRFIP